MGKTEVLFEEVMSADHNNAKAKIVVELNGEKHVFADVEYFELFIEKNKNEVITLGKTSFPFVLGAVEAANGGKGSARIRCRRSQGGKKE